MRRGEPSLGPGQCGPFRDSKDGGHSPLQAKEPWPGQEGKRGGGRQGHSPLRDYGNVVRGLAGFRPHPPREQTQINEPSESSGGLNPEDGE